MIVSLAISSLGLLGSQALALPFFHQEVKVPSMKERLKAMGKMALKEADQLETLPIYSYPYVRLADEMRERGVEEIVIFSYGSLMSNASAARTLSPMTLETKEAAIAFGLKRLYNRDVKIRADSRYGIPKDPDARGMLNVEITRNYQEVVNGVVFRVSVKDVPAMLSREEGYDLVPVLYMSWDEFQEGKEPTFKVAYTFRAKNLGPYTSSDILPRPGYYELTRDAAKEYGPEFYTLWRETTYHADGITKVS